MRLVAAAVFVVGLLLLTSAPPAEAAKSKLMVHLTPAYRTGVLYAPAAQISYSTCVPTDSLTRAPSFNFTTGVTKFEMHTFVRYCGANLSNTGYSLESGVTNLSFWIKSNFTGNASVHWTVSGVFRWSAAYNGTGAGGFLIEYGVEIYYLLRDITSHPHNVWYVKAARVHGPNGTSGPPNSTKNGTVNIGFWGVPTFRGITFIAGHHYQILTYIYAGMGTSFYPGAGAAGFIAGTLDFATGSYGAKLWDFQIVR